LAFRGSCDLRLAIILAPALLPLGAAAGTDGERRFCKAEQTAARGLTALALATLFLEQEKPCTAIRSRTT
jgi:hypothetical protein